MPHDCVQCCGSVVQKFPARGGAGAGGRGGQTIPDRQGELSRRLSDGQKYVITDWDYTLRFGYEIIT